MTQAETIRDDGGHTPGPWEAQDFCDGEEGFAIIGANLGGLVAYAIMQPAEIDDQDTRRAEANARLIAAAPDMLVALKGFNLKEEWIVGGQADTLTLRVPIAVIQAMAAAVAKAEGSTS